MRAPFDGFSFTLGLPDLSHTSGMRPWENDDLEHSRGGVCFAVLPLANISDPFGIKSDIGAAVSECEQSYAHLISATINRVHGPSFTL